jgi:hypothetical protein
MLQEYPSPVDAEMAIALRAAVNGRSDAWPGTSLLFY